MRRNHKRAMNLSLIARSLKSYKIGDLLVNSGAISQEQLDAALKEQRITGHKLGAILIRQKYTKNSRLKPLQEMY